VSRGKGWVQVDHHGDGVSRFGDMRIYVTRMRTDANGSKALLVIADSLADARRIFSQAAGAF
jgi:hypothetical protein